MLHKALTTLLPLGLLLGCASCTSIPYQRLDRSSLIREPPTTPPGEPQFDRGKANAVLDSVGWVVGVPSKIILWDRRVDNHHVGLETETTLRTYLDYNGLADVKVRPICAPQGIPTPCAQQRRWLGLALYHRSIVIALSDDTTGANSWWRQLQSLHRHYQPLFRCSGRCTP